MGAEPSRLTRAKPGAPAGSTHSTPPSATPHASPLPPPTRHLAPREGSSRPSSRSGEPPAAGPLSGTTASTCAAPRYSTRAPPPDRACALSPTATAAGPAGMATGVYSASSRPSTRACTGATVPKAQCRPTESEKPSPETDTSRPPFSGNAAGLAPATRARRTKLTPAPSEEPPTRRAAGPSSDQAASHTASAEDTRCAAAGSRSTEHDACRLLPATWNTVPSPTQPARCATLRTTDGSRYWNTACPSVHPSRLTAAKPGAPAGAAHSASPSVTPTTALLLPPTTHFATSEGRSGPAPCC